MSALHVLARRLPHPRDSKKWFRQADFSGLRLFCLLIVLSISLGCEPPPPPDTFVGQGEVKQVVSHDRRVVISHEAIPNFFPAKTSTFALRTPALLDQFRLGEYVRFTLERTDQTLYLVQVEKIEGPQHVDSPARSTANSE